MLSKMRRRVVRSILRVTPPLRAVDRLIAIAHFAYLNGRLPRPNSLQISDYVWAIKTSPALDDPLRATITDKVDAKAFIAARLGAEPFPRTLHVFERAAEFDPAKIPARCVIKPAHMSGDVIFHDRGRRELTDAEIARILGWFDESHYWRSRERNYRLLRRRVLCEEQVMRPEDATDLKVMCIDGRPRILQYVGNITQRDATQNFFTLGWEEMLLDGRAPRREAIPRPACLEQMLDIAGRLSAGFPLLRVDFLVNGDRFYVGELTSLPYGTMRRFASDAEEIVFSAALFGVDAASVPDGARLLRHAPGSH